MLFRKLWRTMALYKAQFISMVIMIALGIGVFVGFNMEWASIEANMNDFFEETGFADYRIVSETGFTEEEREKVEKLPGVEAAARYISFSAEIKESGDSLALTVTEKEDVSGFLLMDGDKYEEKSTDSIWLSDKYAKANEIKIGDSLTLVYKGMEVEGKVAGLIKAGEHLICVRDETQLMPDYTTYGFAYISPAMYEKAAGQGFYSQINVRSEMDKKEFTKKVNETLGKTMLVLTKDENLSYAGAMGEVEEGKTMGSILPVLFLLIAALTMVTTMHRLAAQEKTQIGTLKALGFKDRKILWHYTSYAFMVGIIGSVLGAALGVFLCRLIVNPEGAMGTYLDMPEWKLYLLWFCYILLIGMIGLLTLIGFLSVRRMLKGTAADALRPYTPKKMKKLVMERTRLWKSFGFGTRWNLRDIMRHKSRTLMSLIGIVGCMMILVAVMGMRDTMDAFLDMYYEGATNYRTCIYIAEETEKAEREALAAKYKGDSSASISVQIEEKAVSLDIYDVKHDKVRFPDMQSNYVELEDEGAYICSRISKEFHLKEGDEITVSPYGSDKEYRMKVAGVIRSVSENIVITPEYAEKLGIVYTIDTIYTDTEKEKIDLEGSISSLQSKQAVMDSFDKFLEIMNMMIAVFILAGIVLGIVVLYNLGVMSYTERYREMATLKVVGFRDKKIAGLLISQNLWVTVLGAVIGLPGGAAVLSVLLDALASEYEMQMKLGAATYLVSILLTFGVSLLVSVMVARKNRKIDMVEALKGAE